MRRWAIIDTETDQILIHLGWHNEEVTQADMERDLSLSDTERVAVIDTHF